MFFTAALMHTPGFGEVHRDSEARAGFGVGWEMLRLSPNQLSKNVSTVCFKAGSNASAEIT